MRMRRLSRDGYTIIEVMIVLVVSVALFGTVITAMSAQANRTRFTQEVETFEQRLQDILNDVSTGYYPAKGVGEFSCSANYTTGPNIVSASPQEQGTNLECIFIAKVLHFAPNGNDLAYNIYTMVGNRLASANGKEIANIAEARPKVLGVGLPGTIDTGTLGAEVRITKVVVLKTGTSIGGFGIISDFGKTNVVNNSVSGNASRVHLAAIGSTNLTMNPAIFKAAAENPAANIDYPNYSNEDLGIVICLREGGTAATNGRRASITIGGDGQQLSLVKTIDSWPEPECN